MSIFNVFSKKRKPDITTIPYDYDGYNIQFKSGITEPRIYEKINHLITNNGFNINSIDKYKSIKKDSIEDDFWEFYDIWINELKKLGYIIHLDNNMGIIELVNKINNTLRLLKENVQLNIDDVENKYKEEINKYSFSGKEIDNNFNYDILEANIVAGELRKNGYELINFFTGFDNLDKAIIKINDIEIMKKFEEDISSPNN